MTPEERRSQKNGIWMCQVHGKAIDSKDPEFTVERLRTWKADAQRDAMLRVLQGEPIGPVQGSPGLASSELLRTASSADIEVLKRTAKWPATTVPLTLRVEGINEPATTIALARLVTGLDDLILIAPPGMGKTTTLFQIAEGILAGGDAAAIIVPLGDWATDTKSILDSILDRSTFRGVSEIEFRDAASHSNVVLLLDGWNELDGAARDRARVQIATLKAELPNLSLVISTRKQARDVPFTGLDVELLALNEEQQVAIARALRGESGEQIVDQAWRTPGVRDLITIPLYLTVLLSRTEGAPFPATKEEILRQFVDANEADAHHAEALHRTASGLQQTYLVDLASLATSSANTAVTETNARRSVSATACILVEDGQIATRPEPNELLETLVSEHLLARAGDVPGYSFQHQQFQEWYASYDVEDRATRSLADPVARAELARDVLNERAWEEAILFATERLSRGSSSQQQACAQAILDAFGVDPLLAAEMIFRSTDAVWSVIDQPIQDRVRRWHSASKVDRAVRFMIASGRSEFLDIIWPLISSENNQIHLAALRAGRRFRTSVLGADAKSLLANLPVATRMDVLQEIASNSGIDGLDLVTTVARADSDIDLKVAVIKGLAFRIAHRHIVRVLESADRAIFDKFADTDLLDDIAVSKVQNELAAARERLRQAGLAPAAQLRLFLNAPIDHSRDDQIAALVAELEPDRTHRSSLLYDLNRAYPQAVADGVLRRIRSGGELSFGADDFLAAAGIIVDDDSFAAIALAASERRDMRVEAAASVLGPIGAGALVEQYLEVHSRLRDVDGRFVQEASDRYSELHTRITHVPGASLVAAIKARSAGASPTAISQFARLLYRGQDADDERARPFDPDDLREIRAMVIDWGERLLSLGDGASRTQKAEVASLAGYCPSPDLLPVLRRLLDDNLERYRAFRAEAIADGWRGGQAANEASWPHMNEYRNAFAAIGGPETTALMVDYLPDLNFGAEAAWVLWSQWQSENEPPSTRRLGMPVDFSRVEARREARRADPAATTTEAEAIFRVIEGLTTDGANDEEKTRGVILGAIALRLPHGDRSDAVVKLIALAPRRLRANLLLALVLSGETVPLDLVRAGIAETFEAAQKQNWLIAPDQGHELRDWLRLLPFVDRDSEIFEVVRSMPAPQRSPDFLHELIWILGGRHTDSAEAILFQLADFDSRFYDDHEWNEGIWRDPTPLATQRLIDMIAEGKFGGRRHGDWRIAQRLAELINDKGIRDYVYAVLRRELRPTGFATLAQAIAENPDPDGLYLLMKLEAAANASLVHYMMIEHLVTDRIPSDNWKGAYETAPKPAPALRAHLLALTALADLADAATRYLEWIDEERDLHGAPEGEPRHPDLASGKSWPFLGGNSGS